ncbi:MAG: 3-hydroxyacyl-CoA dehydrogenase NAD-binding domain-containing protein [Verrucomicrobia bacterium]|nr:3-hydroxyacyl-CoA dehydrogenase NAD-binding domain-containing protein [Verrucomicrobiota bacterium]
MSCIASSVTNGVCVLRLNAPPVNTLSIEMLGDLRAGVRQANTDASVRSIVITGTPEHFSAGADVAMFRDIKIAKDAERISRAFQEAFQEIEDSAKPVTAAVAGKMMGGALELAMACHYRVCARGTVFSMPEVNLGINPGAGGTQRLPRLIGVEAALKMLLTGQPISATEALKLGLVDAMCDAADLTKPAQACAGAPRKTRERVFATVSYTEAEKLVARSRPELIASSVILECVRTGVEQSFATGLRAEQEGFARCMDTLATRNKIHVFFATRETAKAPDLANASSRVVAHVAVIGMGSMGTGIAQAVLQAGLPVIALDENAAALQKGQQRIRESLQKRATQGKLPPERLAAMLGALTATSDWSAIGGADLVIEAVFEDIAIKRAVLTNIERAVADTAIIASNTSTISFDTLAEGMRRPGRFVGLHFFNPAHAMPLLEIIRHAAAAPETVATALRFAKTIRKTPVLVRNREGFLVNRIFLPYVNEAFLLLADGAEPEAVDRAMVVFGFPMGPLTLIDMAGNDILVHCDAVLTRAFPHHGPTPPIVAELVARGMLGQKSGAGVYLYEKGDPKPRPNPAAQEIITAARHRDGRSPRAIAADEITQRLVLRMVAEALRVMEEGIVQRESDVDAAMVLGTGFPDWRGGVLKYARDIGLKTVLNDLEILRKQLGERFAPCKMLGELKGT